MNGTFNTKCYDANDLLIFSHELNSLRGDTILIGWFFGIINGAETSIQILNNYLDNYRMNESSK